MKKSIYVYITQCHTSTDDFKKSWITLQFLLQMYLNTQYRAYFALWIHLSISIGDILPIAANFCCISFSLFMKICFIKKK